MRGLPVTVRLLDPPLHEFLPLEHFEAEVRRLESAADDRLTDAREAAEIVRDLQEANPMLGTRGVRLAFLYPQIYEMQVRAVIAAAAEAAEAGDTPHVEIMIPLVAYETELRQLREHVVNVAEEARRKAASPVPYSVGTMIELPRACLIAGQSPATPTSSPSGPTTSPRRRSGSRATTSRAASCPPTSPDGSSTAARSR